MAKLTKAQIAAHNKAEAVLTQTVLSEDDREFVLDNWQESARHINSAAGAFFTPSGLARDLAFFSQGTRVIDLCAGIGALGLWNWWVSGQRADVTCIEANPDYVEVGRKIFPEATWICDSVENAAKYGTFDIAISNPPFGHTAKIAGPRYRGEDDLAVVDIASDIADYGVFILPAMSCPFEYSGRPDYRTRPSAKFERFAALTRIELQCESVDCGYYANEWRGASPKVEMAYSCLEEARRGRRSAQPDMFLSEVA